MTKLLRVARAADEGVLFIPHGPRDVQITPITPNEYKVGQDQFKVVEFFTVWRDEDIPLVVAYLAKQNPGCEVQVYELEAISWCPAAEMQTKKVTKDGVFPEIA